jgi:hypothetical protein
MFSGAAKWANLSAATGNRAGVFSAMLFNKIALAVPPLVLGSIALAIMNPFPGTRVSIVAAAVSLTVLVATALVLHRKSGPVIDGFILAVSGKALVSVRTAVQSVVDAVSQLRSMPASGYAVTTLLSLFVFGLSMLSISFSTQAVNVAVPVAAFFWISMFLFISRLLPLTVGNLGIREGILVLCFGLYGIEPATAILVGLLMFSGVIIVGAIGAGYQIAIAMGWLKWTLDNSEQDRHGAVRQ